MSSSKATILRRMRVSIPGIKMKLSEYSELIATEVDMKGSNPCIGCNGDVAAPAPVRGEGVLPVRTISTLTKRGAPDHELRTKAGNICSLMCNLSFARAWSRMLKWSFKVFFIVNLWRFTSSITEQVVWEKST